jgi:hypothetical protein
MKLRSICFSIPSSSMKSTSISSCKLGDVILIIWRNEYLKIIFAIKIQNQKTEKFWKFSLKTQLKNSIIWISLRVILITWEKSWMKSINSMPKYEAVLKYYTDVRSSLSAWAHFKPNEFEGISWISFKWVKKPKLTEKLCDKKIINFSNGLYQTTALTSV